MNQAVSPSGIRRISTYRWAKQPNIVFVEVETEDGLVGLGESTGIPTAIEAVVHDFAVPLLKANERDSSRRQKIWLDLFGIANIWNVAGAEMRAMSALDLAFWDLAGQRAGVPIFELLGGAVRDSIPIYNTCVSGGRYEDSRRQEAEPGALAQELLDAGIGAMKIWPFDRFAPTIDPLFGRSHGSPAAYLRDADLAAGIAVVAEIRERVGSRMAIMIEGHHRWDVAAAIRIGRALEPYAPMWMEDMTLTDNPSDLRRLVEETRVPILASERLMGHHAYRALLEARGVHVVMLDLSFVGGLTEGQKVAAMADAHNLPITAHDCAGPVVAFANLHFSIAAPNAMIAETARAFYDGGWYGEVVTDHLPVRGGQAEAPSRPGLGTALQPQFRTRADVAVRSSALEGAPG